MTEKTWEQKRDEQRDQKSHEWLGSPFPATAYEEGFVAGANWERANALEREKVLVAALEFYADPKRWEAKGIEDQPEGESVFDWEHEIACEALSKHKAMKEGE